MLKLNLTPFPELITPRLFLRELRMEDAGEIFLLRSDERVNEFVDRATAISIDDGRQFISKIITAQHNSEGIMWAITLKNEPKLIGTIVYWNIIKEKDEAEVGYELLPQWHGKGIMQEALSKVIEFGFTTLGIKTIVAGPKAGNQRSVKLLEKCGFTKMNITEDGYLIYKLHR